MHVQAKTMPSGQKLESVAPNYTNGGGYETIVPYDLAKIYNIAPLYTAGISGQGMKIVVVEDTKSVELQLHQQPRAPATQRPATGPSSATRLAWASTQPVIFRRQIPDRQ